MSVYYDYIVSLGQRLVPAGAGPHKALDYGCGAGQIVDKALAQGLDAYGVDIFYAGGSHLAEMKASPRWNTRIFELVDGKRIPMPDGTFDLVFANQVFEHIDDFTTPLAEIERVMKPGAVFINIFPSRKVWREGHIGIPFAHLYPPASKARYLHTLALRSAGLGYHKGTQSAAQWSKGSLKWIDEWTYYKPYRQIVATFAKHFSVEIMDADYILYRLSHHPHLKLIAPAASTALARPIMGAASARLAGHVFVLRKPQAPQPAAA